MIRFGLLGCGRIAKRHSELLGGNHIDRASLVAVCDPVRARADAISSRFGVPAHYDMDDFLGRKDIDAVAVLTPSGLHPKHVIACAKAGKHVVVEKPMALRLQDADDMIRACDEAGVKLFVVKQNRFNVPVAKAREAFEAGRFGRLILGTVRVRWCRDQAYYDQDAWRGTWAYDGGVLTNQASHHVDTLEWFFGDVVSVHARAITALAKIETEDTAVATLKFKNGALGIIEATTAARPTDLEGSLSILGEKGTVEIAGFAVNQIRHWRFAEELPSDNASYSIYLLHYIVFLVATVVAVQWVGLTLPAWACEPWRLAIILICCLISSATWHLIERPMIALGNQIADVGPLLRPAKVED